MDDDLGRDETCPACHSHGTLRPHIVWFGEVPLYMDDIQHALEDSDLFVSIGTSGSVYPAAGFVNEARYLGLRTCEINLEPSENAPAFEERYYGPASTAVPEWVDGVLKVLAARRLTRPSSGTVLSAPEHMAVPAFIPLKEKGSLPAAEGSLLM